MSGLQSLRLLVNANVSGKTVTGTVVDVSTDGAVQVLSGSKVITCTSVVSVKQGDRVRVSNLVVLSKIDQVKKDIPIFRV